MTQLYLACVYKGLVLFCGEQLNYYHDLKSGVQTAVPYEATICEGEADSLEKSYVSFLGEKPCFFSPSIGNPEICSCPKPKFDLSAEQSPNDPNEFRSFLDR